MEKEENRITKYNQTLVNKGHYYEENHPVFVVR